MPGGEIWASWNAEGYVWSLKSCNVLQCSKDVSSSSTSIQARRQLSCAQREVLNLRVCWGQRDTSMASSPSRPNSSREASWCASSSRWQSTFADSLHQTNFPSFIKLTSAFQPASSIHLPRVAPSQIAQCSSTRLSEWASWLRRTVEGLVEMWGERRSNRARRLNTQPRSRGRPTPWGNSSTVTSFSSKNLRSHPLEAGCTPFVTEPGRQRQLISQIDFKSWCDLQRVQHGAVSSEWHKTV